MEALADVLQPHKESVGAAASVVTILQFFSGIFICRDVFRQNSTKGISAIPFIGGIVLGILLVKFALILQDANMFNVNIVAIALNALYLGFYTTFSVDKYTEVILPSLKGAAISTALLVYVAFEDPDVVEFRYSLLVTVFMLLLISSPLFDVKTLIAEKDTSCIPLPMTLMGCLVSFLWLLYGVILRNVFMIFQNVLGFSLCMVQLILIAKYAGVAKTKMDERMKKHE